jgi:ABC-type Mn2+/Zn2+ transport system ATPase subunit
MTVETDMKHLLEISDLNVSFHGRSILHELSLKTSSNEFIVLLGANGSGKTTLLRAIMGLVNPCAGRICFAGDPLKTSRQRTRIAYVPQMRARDYRMPMSVYDVVAIGLHHQIGLGRRPDASHRALVEQALEAVGIGHLAQRPIGHLSGGEGQKVQIARALCQSPALLLLDEPAASLDLGARSALMELLGKIHRERKLAIILVMHDLHCLPSACERAVILHEGRKCYDGVPSEVFKRANLALLYGDNAASIGRELVSFSAEWQLDEDENER